MACAVTKVILGMIFALNICLFSLLLFSPLLNSFKKVFCKIHIPFFIEYLIICTYVLSKVH